MDNSKFSIEYDVDIANRWSLRQYRAFSIAAKEGDFDAVLDLIRQVVTKWSLDLDISDRDAWLDGLNVGQWRIISTTVGEALSKEFANPKK